MVDLAGELIAFPLPNKPGMWAYRKLASDEVLEVQLTKEEWLQLHGRHHDEELDKKRDLDKHPLNQAALTVLDEAGERPLANEICLISLARYALDDDTPNLDDCLMALSDWSRSLGTMQKAIWVLEHGGVTPEDLLSENLEDAAEVILRQLVE